MIMNKIFKMGPKEMRNKVMIQTGLSGLSSFQQCVNSKLL